MNNVSKYEAQARIAKALGHPSRLMILDLILHEEKCVADLTEAVGADQSTVSKHLAMLRNVGLVESRKDGTTQNYRASCECISEFFSCLESALRSDIKKRQSALKR